MKDLDNKTNNLCYCKDYQLAERHVPKGDDKEEVLGKKIEKSFGEKAQPWSVFGEWYWI